MKIYIIVFFILNILILQGCNNGGDYMDSSNVEKIRDEADLVFLEYSNIVKNNRENLIKICDWLNSKDGEFYMYVLNGKIDYIDTNKGEHYKTHENIELLLDVLIRNNFSGISQGSEENSEIIFFRNIIKKDKQEKIYIFHRLIYDKSEEKAYHRYRRIDENFYYLYAVGE